MCAVSRFPAIHSFLSKILNLPHHITPHSFCGFSTVCSLCRVTHPSTHIDVPGHFSIRETLHSSFALITNQIFSCKVTWQALLSTSSGPEAKGSRKKAELLPFVPHKRLWLAINTCFRGLQIQGAPFHGSPSFCRTASSISGSLTCSFSLPCFPTENVTMGSKSKLDLILIRLIEEPNPKVEGGFDLGNKAGGGGGGLKISRGLAALGPFFQISSLSCCSVTSLCFTFFCH